MQLSCVFQNTVYISLLHPVPSAQELRETLVDGKGLVNTCECLEAQQQLTHYCADWILAIGQVNQLPEFRVT